MSIDLNFWMTWIIVPVLIFVARIADVSLGTLRIVFVSKGIKLLAPILGFFEVIIWLLAVSRIFENLDNWLYFISYAAGFAMGNYVGLLIEERLALGYVNLRIITHLSGEELIKNLIDEGYGITLVDAKGSMGDVSIIFCVIKRNDYKQVAEMIKKFNPNSFYTIEDIRFANQGVFPSKTVFKPLTGFHVRKGK
ncbi:MAG: DUF2179 domain-containing protein [Marinilabiliaceae bacterium]|nr:DUF2179 domain-containing protein [Marinilabiliaceae bacterium]